MQHSTEDLIEIQTRLAFQEDTIAQLNHVVTQQNSSISLLQQQMRLLAKRIDDLAFAQQDTFDATSERPPHY
jgi:SlyX protein